MHRDVHPRNILIDEQTDSPRLIDFGFAIRIDRAGILESDIRNDVADTALSLYEVITRDLALRHRKEGYPSLSLILDVDTWVCHPEVHLDHDVKVFRQTLERWLDHRKSLLSVRSYQDCLKKIRAQFGMPPPPMKTGRGTSNTAGPRMNPVRRKTDWDALGLYQVPWQRPAQNHEDRFTLGSGIVNSSEDFDSYSYSVFDWDQRCDYVVSGELPPGTLGSELEDAALARIARATGDSIRKLPASRWWLDLDFEFQSEGLDIPPPMDVRLTPFHTRLADCPTIKHLPTIKRTQLVEIERMIPSTDICYYTTSGSDKVWNGIQYSYIASSGRIIVDEVDRRVVGFTTSYIPGRNLSANQLMQVVDDLTIKDGVQHGDIRPRNVLLDHEQDCVKIIDFGQAHRTGQFGQFEYRETYYQDDAVGLAFSMYEIMTRDESLRNDSDNDRTLHTIMGQSEWQLHRDVRLDCSVQDIRGALSDWIRDRKERTYKDWRDCPEPIPEVPGSPDKADEPMSSTKHKPEGGGEGKHPSMSHKFMNGDGDIYLVKWLRPESSKRLTDAVYLADGELLEGPLEPVQTATPRTLLT
ncbi:casein kinase II subunit alpha [Sphaceloma murrayae]|uniref:EKC/KEOPS complex subunit BUD32 n=1 Tax=Sphaceloma murrayae TaxID=2082308 RepID=A0A2K1QIS3_9PEZI|nr:casein kinase II subunit alpha [Sphaceloma murrayae]